MADKNERKRILQMVKDGTMTLDEAAELLDAVEEADSSLVQSLAPVEKKKPKYKFLRVEVDAAEDPGSKKGNAKVRVNIPLSLAKSGLSLAQKFIPKDAQATMAENNVSVEDIMEILEHLDDFEDGDIVNIDAADNNGQDCAKVRIYLE